MQKLTDIGLTPELLDLREYFNKPELLRQKLLSLGGVYVRGGNTFILRQAMKLSGFDTIFQEMLEWEKFVYAGYSAGVCVLSERLNAYGTVDSPIVFPYQSTQQTIWEGLGYLPYIFLPHYKSDHPESVDVDKEVEYCIDNKILFKALRDGEVIIIE